MAWFQHQPFQNPHNTPLWSCIAESLLFLYSIGCAQDLCATWSEYLADASKPCMIEVSHNITPSPAKETTTALSLATTSTTIMIYIKKAECKSCWVGFKPNLRAQSFALSHLPRFNVHEKCAKYFSLLERNHTKVCCPASSTLNKALIINFGFLIQIPTSTLLLPAWVEPDQAIVAKDDWGSNWQLVEMGLTSLHQAGRHPGIVTHLIATL